MADPDAGDDVASPMVHAPDARLLVASGDGRGFVASEREVIANTRKGKQIFNVSPPVEARACARLAEGDDHVAVIGENRKLPVFPLEDLPEMARSRGNKLQSYGNGGLSDARTFRLADGLAWRDSAGRTRTVDDLHEWIGKRAQAGRLPPKGFPRNNRFS